LAVLELELAFSFPFSVAERLAVFVLTEVRSVVFTAIEVCIFRQFWSDQTRHH